MPLLQAFWLFLPAGIANMAPSLLRRLPVLGAPLDFGLTFRGKRLLGDHKTVRGLLVAPLAGWGCVWIQQELSNTFPAVRAINLFANEDMSLGIGAVIGLGAVLGDAVKSFFKRQFNIAPGRPWFPFDQIDFTLGALALLQFFYRPPLPIAGLVLLFGLLLHPLANLLGFSLKLQSNKF